MLEIQIAPVQEFEVHVQDNTQTSNVPRADSGPSNPAAAAQAPQRSQRRASRRNQVTEEMDRLTLIEEKRVEAELLTARALANVGDVSSAIRDGAGIIANALIDIARQLSRNS